MNSSNIFSKQLDDGTIFWSQILPRVEGGFVFWYADSESIEVIEFEKIVSTQIFQNTILSNEKQILLLIEFENNYSAYKFGNFKQKIAEEFLSWLQNRLIN